MRTGTAFCDHEGSAVHVAGSSGGLLEGLNFGAKDLYDVAGHRCCCGNPDWLRTHEPATRTASAIEVLVRAGASLVGKTATDELAYSILGVNHWYGTPPNPAAPDRIPGGSSSGSASAVAAGAVDFAIGTDTGGSIRVPASWCGLYSFRPTHGCIPLDGVFPLAPSFDTCGWLARDPIVLERVGHVLLPDERAPAIGQMITVDELWAVASAEVQRVAGEYFETHLGNVSDHRAIADPFFSGRNDAETFRVLQGAEIHALHHEWIERVAPAFGVDVGTRLRSLRDLTSDEIALAGVRQQELRDHLLRLTADALLAVPTTAVPAPRRDEPPEQIAAVRPAIMRLTCIASLCGLPQVTVPAGVVDGAPVGLSLIGPPGCDRALLGIAAGSRR